MSHLSQNASETVRSVTSSLLYNSILVHTPTNAPAVTSQQKGPGGFGAANTHSCDANPAVLDGKKGKLTFHLKEVPRMQ